MATFKVGAVRGKYKKGDYIGKWGSGYYWSHISETGFDWFLIYMLQCNKERFASRSKLKKGQICIGKSSGHTYVIIDDNQRIFEANTWGDQIIYGRSYVDYDPYWVYTLPWEDDEIEAFLYNLKQIADDDSYYYSHNNSLGNYTYYNAKGLDCCTSICLALYITLGWTWANQTYQNANYQYVYVSAGQKAEVKNGLSDSAEADGRWAYYTDGKIDTSVTTVAKNKNGWWYVKNGYVDFSYYGLAKNQYGWWVIEGGKVNFNAKTGFYGNEYGWWWCEGGKVMFDKNELLRDPYDGDWVMVKGGKLVENYNGICANSNGLWRMVDGKVDFTPGTYDVKVQVQSDGLILINPKDLEV